MTPDTLIEWASDWNIPPAAFMDLLKRMSALDVPPASLSGAGEAIVQARVRLSFAQKGGRAWRNNVGALPDPRGVPVRFGLANDSQQVNKWIKSADLIGIKPVTIRSEHVGHVIGQFWSRECKAADWTYTGTEREQAQLRWLQLVVSLGGDAAFTTGAV